MKLLGWLLALGQAVAQGAHLNVFAFNPFGLPQEALGPPVFSRPMVDVREVYDGPVVILSPNLSEQGNEESFHAFIAPQGLSSLSSNLNFQPFYKYLLQHSELSGLAFFPRGVSSNVFLQSAIQDVILPDKHNAADFLHLIDNPHIPVVYIAPQEVFNRYHFTGLNQLATLSVSDEQIVVLEVFDPFHHPLDQAAAVPVDPVTTQPQQASPVEKLTSVFVTPVKSFTNSEEAEDRDVSDHLPEETEGE